MARSVGPTQPLVASVLDRLLDDDPDNQRESDKSRNQTLREVRQALRRDLESLLNSRRRVLSVPRSLTETNRSLASYGLPDLTNVNVQSDDTRSGLCRMVEILLERFETRFKTAEVSILENSDPLDRTLRFRIKALMHAEPAPELVIFDTHIEPVTSAVNVKDSVDG